MDTNLFENGAKQIRFRLKNGLVSQRLKGPRKTERKGVRKKLGTENRPRAKLKFYAFLCLIFRKFIFLVKNNSFSKTEVHLASWQPKTDLTVENACFGENLGVKGLTTMSKKLMLFSYLQLLFSRLVVFGLFFCGVSVFGCMHLPGLIKTEAVKNLLTARQLFEFYLKQLTEFHFSW